MIMGIFRTSLIALAATLALPFAGSAQNQPPIVSSQIADLTLYDAAPSNEIDLSTKFSDPDLPRNTVRLTTILGDIDVTLLDQQTPITVDNFLRYIDSGAYFPNDPVTGQPAPLFFHRSIPGFVIQSGGYAATLFPQDPSVVLPTLVATFSAIQNEARPDLHNVRGTIAMAKLPDDADSATSQWFINLADNSGNLDSQDGGFTVFGQIGTVAMSVADAIAALPRFDASVLYGDSAFTDLPLRNFSGGSPQLGNFALVDSITRPLQFSAASDHPNIATASVIGDYLFVQGVQIGSAAISVVATDAFGASVGQTFNVTVIPTPPHLANIATRLQVAPGDDALIGGFIVRGDQPKRVIIRGTGPSLGAAMITGTLADPLIELHDQTGAIISTNDNWGDAPNKRDIINSTLAPTDLNESAILTTLPSNSTGIGYTVVVRGSTAAPTGIGLVEIYDLDSGPGSSILNISTRGNVQVGDDAMIGGIIITGEGDQLVVVRAIGPSLASSDIANPLLDPTLTLVDGQGTQVDFNDNWQSNPDAAAIEATTLAPTDPRESAVLQTLAPGGYTAIVRGTGTTTGTGLVEVYALQSAN